MEKIKISVLHFEKNMYNRGYEEFEIFDVRRRYEMKNLRVIIIAVLVAALGGGLIWGMLAGDTDKIKEEEEETTANLNNPVISLQPQNIIAENGETVTFTVASEGANAYQWQYSVDDGQTWVDSEGSGNNTASMSFTMMVKFSGRKYRCRVKNSDGTTISKEVTLSLKVTKPVVITQPQSINVAAGEMVVFSLKEAGAAEYQWQYSVDGGQTWSNSSGEGHDTASMSFKMTGKFAGRMYRCKLTNEYGSVYSKEATLSLK